MSNRRRVVLLLLIMTGVAAGVAGITLSTLYQTAFEEARERLVETAQSQARLVEAVARFDARHSAAAVPGGAYAATLGQIREAHENFKGFGKTGEFTLAKREGDRIVFLLSHRHFDMENPQPVSISSAAAEPMRRALTEEEGGTVVGLDYRGAKVLAAYEPLSEMGLGIVAKIDLWEIRAPFLHAGLLSGVGALVLVLCGTVLFRRVSNPLIQRLEVSERQYRTLFESASDGVGLMAESFEECNEQLCRLWGRGREDVLGKTLADFSPKIQPDGRDSGEAAADFVQAARAGQAQSVAWRFQGKDGGQIDAEVSLKAIALGDRSLLLVAVRDVTERMRAEEQRRFSERQLTIRNQIAHIFLFVDDDEVWREVLRVILAAVESKLGFWGYIDEAGALVCPTMTEEVWERCQMSDKNIVFPRETWGGIWGQALLEKRAVCRNEPCRIPEGHIPLERALRVPLVRQEELFGLVAVANKAADYTEEDREQLLTIVGMLSPILYARLQRDKQSAARRLAEEQILREKKFPRAASKAASMTFSPSTANAATPSGTGE